MARKSSYIKVTGCVEAKQRKVRDDVGDATYIRVENIIEMCEVVGTQRLQEESTQAEYDAREQGTDADWDARPNASPPAWYRYVPTTELTLGFVEHHLSRTEYSYNTPATRVHIGLLVPESIEALIARIDATEFPPPPAPEEPPAAEPSQQRRCGSVAVRRPSARLYGPLSGPSPGCLNTARHGRPQHLAALRVPNRCAFAAAADRAVRSADRQPSPQRPRFLRTSF